MEMTIITDATALQPAFVAPTLGGSTAGVCPQAGYRRVDDAHTQANLWAFGDAGMATGYRSWSPLIT
jgi:hypothetical protein